MLKLYARGGFPAKGEKKIMKRYCREVLVKAQFSDKTFYDYLVDSAKMDGKLPLLVTEKYEKTRQEVLEITDGLIAYFSKKGISKGDVVAFRATRTAETITLMFSLFAVGALVAFCDPHFPLKTFIASSGVEIVPNWYITDEGGEWEILDADFAAPEPLNIWQQKDYDKNAVAKTASNTNAYDPTLILFTSGTTGGSKAIIAAQHSLLNGCLDMRASADYMYGDVILEILPLHHMFALALVAAAVITHQTMVFPTGIDIEDTLKNIERYKVSRLFGVPTYFIGMAMHPNLKKYDISSLRIGYTGGGPYTEQQFRNIEAALGCYMLSGYGMSEFFAITLSHQPAPIDVRAKGVGFVYKSIDCKILDSKGNELPLETEGEICVKGYPMMIGYYNDPKATAEIIDKNGYLHTGDLGYLDDCGILYITGRIKELIIRGGENYSPYKIEAAITSLPYVNVAAVCGIKDEVFGEVPAVMLSLKDKSEKVTEEKLKKDLLGSGKLIKPELPAKVLFVEDFPYLATGKIDRLKVKEILTAK